MTESSIVVLNVGQTEKRKGVEPSHLMHGSFQLLLHGQGPLALLLQPDAQRVDFRPLVSKEPVQILRPFFLLLKARAKKLASVWT